MSRKVESGQRYGMLEVLGVDVEDLDVRPVK